MRPSHDGRRGRGFNLLLRPSPIATPAPQPIGEANNTSRITESPTSPPVMEATSTDMRAAITAPNPPVAVDFQRLNQWMMAYVQQNGTVDTPYVPASIIVVV